MVSIILKESRFEPQDLKLESSKYKYPYQIRIRLRTKYNKVILKKDGEEVEVKSGLSVYILSSEGWLRLNSTVSNRPVEIICKICGTWKFDVKYIDIISEPLTLDEIYEIEQILGKGDVQVYWSVDGWGFLDRPEGYNLPIGTLVNIYVHSEKHYTITRQDFVKNILEQADMLKRRFIEVIMEPLDPSELDKITDLDVREGLRLLLDKQSFLQDSIEKLTRAKCASEYRDVLDEVRRTIEGLTQRSQSPKTQALFNSLKNAFKSLGIAREIDGGALDALVDEVIKELDERIIKGLFKYTSKLGIHAGKAGGNLQYEPRPMNTMQNLEFYRQC